MKKLALLVLAAFAVLSLSACKQEEVLTVYFVPSRDAAEILEATEPLKQMLIDELAAQGYEYDKVDIFVGSSYEAAAEAMVSGQAEIGFLPGGTYVLYAEDDAGNQILDVALTATRAGLSVESADPVEWNNNEPIVGIDEQVTFYRGLLVAGPSVKGQELAAKVNAGTALTWEDLQDAVFCVRSATSSSGYIYPTLWLMENFDGKTFADLPSENVIQTSGYGASMSSLAAETCDVGTFYADARRTYADAWQSTEEGGYGMTNTIWEDTDVIGVTDRIYNDTIAISTELVDADLKAAIQQAFINIAATEEGQQVISIYSHEGYQVALDSDYDKEREAQNLLDSN